jgi:hypothetical protein
MSVLRGRPEVIGARSAFLTPMTGCEDFEIMSIEGMSDEGLVRYYENVRQQVEADRAGNHKFMMNPTVQQYADRLQSEMIKRGLEHSPIQWPQEMARKHREVVDEVGQQESNPVATGKSPMIGVQMQEEMQDLIKNPAEQNDHPLSDTIRSLVERGLKAKK